MEETKFNAYVKNILDSIDYKKTLHIINTYLLEMQSLLNEYDFNKRIHDLHLIVIIPENDDAVTMFETYTGIKLLNKKSIIDKLTEFNNYKYKRIYGEFFNSILSNDITLKQYRALFYITDDITSIDEKYIETRIYTLQYPLRRQLNRMLNEVGVEGAETKYVMDLIRRICGGEEDRLILEGLDIRNFSDKDFLNYDEVTFINKYFDLDEFVK
nr:MAG TPA: hypothetical protein [Caudoviricetes sp.]